MYSKWTFGLIDCNFIFLNIFQITNTQCSLHILLLEREKDCSGRVQDILVQMNKKLSRSSETCKYADSNSWNWWFFPKISICIFLLISFLCHVLHFYRFLLPLLIDYGIKHCFIILKSSIFFHLNIGLYHEVHRTE